MTGPDSTPAADAALQFDQAERAAATAPAQGVTCSGCKKTLTGVYHMVNATVICSTCRQRLEREFKGGSGSGRFAKALMYGLGGAVAGSLIYYAVLAATDMEIGLI